MPEISIYVAVIAAATAVLGAAVAPASTAYARARAAVRDRAEQRETVVRQVCMNLLRAVRDLRVQVANFAAYQGSEMGARLERVRQLEADAASYADEVALLLPGSVAEAAVRLSSAVSALAMAAQTNVKPQFAASAHEPDFTGLDARIEDFRTRVIARSRNAGDQLSCPTSFRTVSSCRQNGGGSVASAASRAFSSAAILSPISAKARAAYSSAGPLRSPSEIAFSISRRAARRSLSSASASPRADRVAGRSVSGTRSRSLIASRASPRSARISPLVRRWG